MVSRFLQGKIREVRGRALGESRRIGSTFVLKFVLSIQNQQGPDDKSILTLGTAMQGKFLLLTLGVEDLEVRCGDGAFEFPRYCKKILSRRSSRRCRIGP
jgi:hypothetical protein